MTKYDSWRWIVYGMVVVAGAVILSLAFCNRAHAFTLVRVETKAGMITVNSDYAWRLKGFIDALPYTPRSVHCFARYGHVRHSLHHIGGACDIDQHGRNRTSRPMYHVAALAAAWGLRDGCSFRDCGHVDIGFPSRGLIRVAHLHHHRHLT